MIILLLLSWIGYVIGFSFLTLAIGMWLSLPFPPLMFANQDSRLQTDRFLVSHSLWTLLSLGTSGRTHGAGLPPPHLPDLQRHWQSRPPLPRGRTTLLPDPLQHWLPCRLCRKPSTLPPRQAI